MLTHTWFPRTLCSLLATVGSCYGPHRADALEFECGFGRRPLALATQALNSDALHGACSSEGAPSPEVTGLERPGPTLHACDKCCTWRSRRIARRAHGIAGPPAWTDLSGYGICDDIELRPEEASMV